MIPARKPDRGTDPAPTSTKASGHPGRARTDPNAKDAPVATPPSKTWRLLPHDAEAVQRLARSLQVPHLVAQLLLNRGLDAPEQARRFLDAPLAGLHAPDRLPGVSLAAERIPHAVSAGW